MQIQEPEQIKRMADEVASVFDVTLLTTHPSELGRGNEWLIWLELDSGEEFWEYADVKHAGERRYVEEWIKAMHHKIVRARSVR